jgi:hypothetical protein
MKAVIQLALVSIVLFTSCKKEELEEVEPINTDNAKASEPPKVRQNSQDFNVVNFDPENPNRVHY